MKKNKEIVSEIKNIFINNTENEKLIFLRYIITGGIVTGINIILLYLFVEYLKLDYKLSNIISMLICITITYIISKKIIFHKKVKIRSCKRVFKLYRNCNNINNYRYSIFKIFY